MSNQCCNLCNFKSFSLCAPFIKSLKPYNTTRLPLFPIQHSFILIGRRPRRRSSSSHLKYVTAQLSSSDVVLIETKEHSDGSLVFRFGDASEVVENDDVEEVIESQTEHESTVVEELDGDQDRQVIIKTDDEGYDSVEGRLVEVADGIKNADIGSDTAENVTNDIRDFRNNNAESSDDISEKQVLVSQPDANLNDFNNVVESTLDEANFSVELNEEESSDPNIYLLDKTPNIEKSEDPEGTVLKGSDDKPVDPSVSVELESTLVSQTEIVDDLDNVEAEDASKSHTENVSSELESTQVLQNEVMDDLDKVETEDRKCDTEDITPSAFPATMPISDIELTDAANEDVEEDLKDMIVNEGTVIDELPLSNPLDVLSMDAVNEDAEEELQDMNINEDTIIDEISSDQLVTEQPTLDEVSQLQSADVNDQTIKDELQQVSTENMEENDVAYVMPVSHVEEADLVVEEEVSEPQLTALKLKPTIQYPDIDLQDTLGQDLDNGILQVDTETKDPSVPVNLEAIQVSDNEVMDVMQPYVEDESQIVESKDTSEGDAQDLPPPATVHVSDVDDINERLQDLNVSEGTFTCEMPTADPVGAEASLEVSTTKGMDVKDVDVNERLQDMNISEGTFVDEMPSSDPLGAEPTIEVSTTKGMDVSDVDMDERLQDINISKVTFIDELPTSEPSLEVSTTKGMDVSDFDSDGRLQDMNIISKGTLTDEMPTSDPSEAEPTLEVSATKDIDEMPTSEQLGAEPTLEVSTAKYMDVDTDERLQDMNISEGTFIDEMPASDPLGAECTLEVSNTKDMDVKDVDMDESLKDNHIREGTFIDEMTTSDPLGAEPTLEVSTTGGLGVKDLAVEAELELVSNDTMDENSNADVMPAEPIVEEEASHPHLTPVELKATIKDSDIKVQDATVDNEILQVNGEDAGDSYVADVEESSHRLESQPLQDEGVNHNMLEQCAETNALESSILLKQGAHDPLLEAERTEGVVGSSELAEASEVTALLSATEAEVESREEIYLTDDILLSGAALLEHPSKALTGGDDAYFVAGSKWLGVANGVSQWSFEGTSPGVYAQELMKTCEEIVLDTSSVPMTNPVELLCRGVKETNMSGSSNVLLAYFNGQDLHVATIGDTGFLIIRHGAVYKKSSPLLHEFHFSVQVDDSDDPLQLVEEYLIELEVGDIVVSATDGLFDNLYEREITMIVSKSLQAGMKPQEIANILATRAQEVGKSSFVRSPFSDAAQAAGYTGYAGGKPDNVAVIVSMVEKRSNLLAV